MYYSVCSLIYYKENNMFSFQFKHACRMVHIQLHMRGGERSDPGRLDAPTPTFQISYVEK